MTSVQLLTKTTLSATLLLVLILGSVLCPPCKARQLMQTPEERIETVSINCDNIERILSQLIQRNEINPIALAYRVLGPKWVELENPNIVYPVSGDIARFCENND